MRLLWLPGVLRSAGLTVHEVSGWKTRGADSYGPVRGITVHHTASSRKAKPADEIRVLLNGSATAPPPISQLALSRTGEWYVVASGLCFHNKIGWDGPNEGFGNDSLLGIEAMHGGGTEPWTELQYRSYVRGVAALVRHKASGYSVTTARVAGHKEHQPGDKSDPTFNMSKFRSDVAALIAAGMEDDMSVADVTNGLNTVVPYASNAGKRLAAEGWGNVSTRVMLEYVWETARGNSKAITALAAQLANRDEVDEVALANALAPAVATAVLAGLPEDRDDISAEELTEAVRSVAREAFSGGTQVLSPASATEEAPE